MRNADPAEHHVVTHAKRMNIQTLAYPVIDVVTPSRIAVAK